MGKGKLSKKAEETIKQWLKAPYDKETREDVKELIATHKDEAEEAFGTTIAFGTGGMREKMGVGPGRINKYTIQMATHGVAAHILEHPKHEWKNGVVICHDCRNHSREFAIEAARVFAGNGIAVHITKDLRPTPFCSYAIRHLGAISGINITASHNPAEYNGYKVYWKDGGQVVPPNDQAIIKNIQSIKSVADIPIAEENSPLISIIDESVEKAYLDTIYKESIYKKNNKENGSEIKICYSPLHGAGITMIPDALKLWGFTNQVMVKDQEHPDGNFPTTKTPNPETEDGRKCGIKTLKEHSGDLLLISDPDSDRLSVSMQDNQKIRTFSGNEIGIIFLHFLATHYKKDDQWASITTIVSTPLCKVITEKLNGKCFEVLTGFKYIAELIRNWEQSGPNFLLGFEESLGYLSSKNVRDKDAVLASCQIAEIALHLKSKGLTLVDYLHDIYKEYGVYREGGISIEFEEKDMLNDAISPLMESPPASILDKKVVLIENYASQISHDINTGTKKDITLPKSNVLSLHLDDGSRYIFRPSGTEPKIKIYGSKFTALSSSSTVADTIKDLDNSLNKDLELLKKTFFTH